MSNQNNVPTAYGLHYRNEDYTQNKVVYVFHNEAYGGALWYRTFGGAKFAVVDDGLWAGPVPMPGESDRGRVVLSALTEEEKAYYYNKGTGRPYPRDPLGPFYQGEPDGRMLYNTEPEEPR